MSSFSSFKTTVDNNNLNDEFGALSEHSHYYLHQQREQQESNRLLGTSATSALAPCLNPHCNHMVSPSANDNINNNTSPGMTTPGSSTTTSSVTTGGRTQKQGMLRRSSAMIGNEPFNPSPSNAIKSPTTPTSTLSPTFSKNSVALSVSLNMSPSTCAGSPPFEYHDHQQHGHDHPQSPESNASQQHHQHHHAHSNLLRTVRAGGGSSTSLSATGSNCANCAPYNGYELSQQLLDKQTSALERKYGGREAREAAIKIQRAFRSYRLQKRFTTLAIQAICHQQLKQQKEQQEHAKQQQHQQQKLQHKQQHQLTVREESVVVEVTPQVLPKMGDALKVLNDSSSSVNLSPIDREAMQHRFSRKLSANYALDDLVRMQALQHQQTIQSTTSGMSSAHHPNQYLSIPRQTSPPVTLITSYEPVYNPPSLYNINNNNNMSMNQHTVLLQQHQIPHQHQYQHQVDGPGLSLGLELPLQKKTSFSSTSSGGSSSSLHASSTSSKPSDLHSTTGRFPTSIIKHDTHDHRLTTSSSIRSQHQQQPQILNKQRMQKMSQQQLQQQTSSSANLKSVPLKSNNNGLSVSQQQSQQGQASIHKTSSHHVMISSGNGNGNANGAINSGNTVAFAPTVDFMGGGKEAGGVEGAVSSSVDAYRKRQYRVGLNLFNKSPSERGIRFLISNGYIEQSDNSETQASYVAHFLLTRKGLSRQMIGEYISEPAAFNRSVLKSFCGGVNLTGIIVDEALRSFQVHFRFPGKSSLSFYL